MLRAKTNKVSATQLLGVIAATCWSVLGCAADTTESGPSGPATNRMFIDGATGLWVEDPVGFARAGGRIYFNDESCWLPDADSFDDYEELTIGIPRGTTPVTLDCAADGIATGPIQFEASGDPMDLLPSKWCPSTRAHCEAVESAGPSEGVAY